MFALVKSLFFSSASDDPASGVNEVANSRSTLQAIDAGSTGNTSKNVACPDEDPSPSAALHNDKPGETEHSDVASAAQPLEASLYIVDGLDFECLMESCTVELDGEMLLVVPQSDGSDGKMLYIRVEQISHLRQHLPDAFQFVVRSSKGEGGSEYGLKVDSEVHAMRLRHWLYPALLVTCETLVTIKCAIAEYDVAGREFVLLSKAATAQVLQRKSDQESFFTIQLPDGRVVFCDALSRESQLWPSPRTHQLTFWGIDYLVPGNTKKMFLLEMLPRSVGVAAVVRFFNVFALVLEDPMFAAVNRSDETQGHIEVDRAEPPEENFDLGSLGNESQLAAWKSLRSSHHATAVSQPRQSLPADGYDFHDLERRSNEDQGDDNEPDEDFRYISDVDRRSTTGPNHRFMEVGSQRTFVCRGESSSPNYPLNMGRDVASRHSGVTDRSAPNFQLEVYKKEFAGDDGEEVLETVGQVQSSRFSFKGQQFVPLKGMLHQEEQKLLVVPEGQESAKEGTVYMMDLNAEKVVQKWNADSTAVSTMFPSFKHGGASRDPTFLCTNSRNIFMMDTRLPPNSAKATSIAYSTNPQLSVGTTDEAGHMLIGSRLGELRLFDGKANDQGNYKRAKTLLQSIREPITAVDVTADGSWILATTKTFLVVFPTRLAGDGRSGFETALGQLKPAPRFLMLNAQDLVKFQITDINFAPAKFDADEECIVTSTGNMAVVWDFGTVKRGKPFYSVRFADESIKDVQVVADSASVVVAYPEAVGVFGTEKRVLEE